MINLLIFENQMEQSRKLINTVLSSLNNVKLYQLATTNQEAIDAIHSSHVDIVLLSLSTLSELDILNDIVQNNLKQYSNSIILLVNDNSLLSQIPYKAYEYIYSVVNRNLTCEELIPSISEIAERKNLIKSDKQVQNQIQYELQSLKFNFTYNGTRYLAETIFELYHNKGNCYSNLKRDIFPILAQRHQKTINTIVGNIKQAINAMYFDCDEKVILTYFNYTQPTKPKPKEVCFTILNKLQ